MIRFFPIFALLLLVLGGCKGSGTNENSSGNDTSAIAAPPAVNAPAFNADSAYNDVAKQVAFGPRIPNSDAQAACAGWMEGRLRAVCDTVYRQNASVTGGDGKSLRCINLIGSIHPKAARRVLLLTHWDCRPWADQDPKEKTTPILAADDGGSGVAVLLEVARALKGKPLPADLGVDILFTDVEDYGREAWGDSSYCLGTQYWALHPHVPGYKAQWGVLLDMVGGRGAQFPMERSSTEFAAEVQQKVWTAAARAGYSSFFPYVASRGGVTDDHVFVNRLAHIPTIDIISLSDGTESGFPQHWHTHADNMGIIDKSTMQAVGQTLLQVLFEEAQGAVPVT